jgi:hypothetical protein
MTNALYPQAVLGPNSGYLNQLSPVIGNYLPNAINCTNVNAYAFDLADRLPTGLPLGYGGSIVGEGGNTPIFLVQRIGRRYGLFPFFAAEILGPRARARSASSDAASKRSALTSAVLEKLAT